MNNADTEYFRLLNLVLDKGKVKKNRTGVDTIGVFCAQARFDLTEGFPLLTTKKVYFRSVIHELLWFLSGSTNIKYLVDNDVHIWDDNCYAKYLNAPQKDLIELGKALWESNNLYPLKKQEFVNLIKNDQDFAKKWGDLGEGTYGGMWRAFPYFQSEYIPPNETGFRETVDQIQKIIDKLKSNPDDRRLIVSAWHPYWVDNCALPPCHCLFQFHTEELTTYERFEISRIAWEMDYIQKYGEQWAHQEFDKLNVPKRRLNCQLYQRSCDLFLGVPFNIASYSLLTSIVAHCVNMVPGEFIHTYGDLHIYSNHLDQVKEQISREPRNLPKLTLNQEVKNLFAFKYEDIAIEGYDPHPAIKAKMAV